MACTWNSLALLVSIFLGVIGEPHLLFVNGDAAPIDSVCRKTGSDGFCHLCFSSYPRSLGKDAKSLVRTSIDCTRFQSIQIRNVLRLLVRSAPKERFKKLLVDGVFAFHDAKAELDTACLSRRDGHYADASNRVLAALKFGQAYEDLLESQVPAGTLGKMIETFDGLATASDGVLREL
nr:hypothetical protein CFP56_02088 [Quercus suber]